MSIKNIEKWCEGKPDPVALAAKSCAPRIGELFAYYQGIRATGFSSAEGMPRLQSWCKMYRGWRRTEKTMFRMFSMLGDQLGEAITQFDAQMKLPVDAETKAIVRDAVAKEGVAGYLAAESVANVMNEVNAFINSWLRKRESDIPDSLLTGDVKELLIFHFHVRMPCVFAFGQQPRQLYHRAVTGDIDALEMLLWLDKSIVADRRIGEQWHGIMWGDNRPLKVRMLKALNNWSKPALTPQKAKMIAAAIVWLVSKSCKCPLSTGEIVQLFSAIAQDLDKAPVDYDFMKETKTLYRAIQREAVVIAPAMPWINAFL